MEGQHQAPTYENLKNTFDIIDAKLYAYNKQYVPATQKPEAIGIHTSSKKMTHS